MIDPILVTVVLVLPFAMLFVYLLFIALLVLDGHRKQHRSHHPRP